MKRFLMLVAVATVAGAMYVAAAPGSQQSRGPTARQFAALKRQVAGLSRKAKTADTEARAALTVLATCIHAAVPINQFGDGQNQTEGYDYDKVSPSPDHFLTTALDATDSADPNAFWITGSVGTDCAQLLTSSGLLPRAAARAGLSIRHGSLLPSFAAHRP